MVRLSPGDTLGHYRIREQLGAGGMGEVYLAEDERLHRLVALKILKAHDRSEEAVERFLFEARAASALNHPNVAHIYEVAELGEAFYIAMEYVEGESLEARLGRGPMPPAEVRAMAMQLADALAEAHAKGIVHRDLKPANIVVNRRGQAKILDFGIAKRVDSGEPLASARTTPGMVVGTLPYMSPEQVRGRSVDRRSDIFSLGVVLYEMISGRRPFDGESLLETVTNIAERPAPPLAAPPALARVVRRCLEKEPARRYADAREIVSELRETETPPRRRSRAVLALAVALAAAVLVIAVGVVRRLRVAPPPRLVKLTAAPGLEDEPAIAPDGRRLAYTSDERGNLDVFVRPLAGGEAVRITGSDADDAQPAWSPDGSRIAFVSAREQKRRLSIVLGQALGNFVNAKGGDLYVAPAAGGAATRLVDDAFYPAWSPDGRWIVFQSARGGQWDLWKIAATGGRPVQLTKDDEFDYQPSWSPDGRSIVFASGVPTEGYRVKVISAEGGAARALTDGQDGILLKPVFSADGRSIIYSSMRGGSLNLWRLRHGDWRRAKPERVTLGEGDDVHAAVSRDGRRVVYATLRQTPDLWTLDTTSGQVTQLTFDTGREETPHRASDGTIAFASDRGGADAIWLLDPQGRMRQLLSRPSIGQPRWSPDRRRLLHRFIENGITHVAVHDPGAGTTTVLGRNCDAPSWSPDGRQITFTLWPTPRSKGQIHVLDADGRGQPRQLTFLDLVTSFPTWSPDGAFISFQATRDDGTRHIWIVEVATGRTRQLTTGASEDSHPQWSPVNADEILFVRNHENLMTVSVSTGAVRQLTRFAEPNTILDYPSWSMDGKRVDFSIARKRGDLYLLETE